MSKPEPADTDEAEQLAMLFHSTYERLAPDYGYKTRDASAKPWLDVPDDNRRLMIAVASEVLLWHNSVITAAEIKVRIEEAQLYMDNFEHGTGIEVYLDRISELEGGCPICGANPMTPDCNGANCKPKEN